MKKRVGFVSNSSSSSFLIVGDCFNTEEAAMEFQKKLEPNKSYIYTYGDKFEDGTEVAGVSLGGFEEGADMEDAEAFVNKIQAAIARCKLAGLETPYVMSGYSCEY